MSAAWAAVIAAAITAVLGFVGNVVITKGQSERLSNDFKEQSKLADANMKSEIEKDRAVTNTKLDELTREVREHNNFARRVPVIEEQIKVANHRIEDLERKTGA